MQSCRGSRNGAGSGRVYGLVVGCVSASFSPTDVGRQRNLAKAFKNGVHRSRANQLDFMKAVFTAAGSRFAEDAMQIAGENDAVSRSNPPSGSAQHAPELVARLRNGFRQENFNRPRRTALSLKTPVHPGTNDASIIENENVRRPQKLGQSAKMRVDTTAGW